MELVKFSNQLGGKDPAAPPYRIPARDLDSNFAKLKPLKLDGNARQYLLTETPEGWSIKIFPDFPSGAGPFFLALSNGRLYWAGSGIDESPDEALQLVEVERCDGKRMKVLGTGWYDP
jgi:hypothetical protein